jgi:hypothetical protein
MLVRMNQEGEYEVGGIRMQLAHGAGPPSSLFISASTSTKDVS